MSLTDEEEQDFFDPGHSANGDAPNVILTAPDYSTFVKISQSRVAKEYEQRVQSLFKAGFFGALRNNNMRDAALYIHFGPNVASTAGALAEKDERVARAIDMITAPDNPYVAFAMAAIGFAAQFARNHEEELRQIPTAVKMSRAERRAQKKAARENGEQPTPNRLQIKLPFGRTLKIGIQLKFRGFRKLAALWHFQTHNPDELVQQVFSDEKLIKALAKENIYIGPKP